MSIRIQIAALIYMMVQSVSFGIGMIFILVTPLRDIAMYLIPLVVVLSALVSLPLSWILAPHLRSRFGKRAAM